MLRRSAASALFAAKFREAAGRALLLPKRRPGGRSPLWQQRKRAADLLAVAARFGSFPMLLEAYRECLRDVFDMPAVVATLRRIETREIRAVTVDSTMPSPFASSLLFGYVANYIYDGDAPLAERRAQALAIDQNQLRELLGEAELRELLDQDALEQVETQLQHLERHQRARSIDGIHDLLLRLGDLTAEELQAQKPHRQRPGDRAIWCGRVAPSPVNIAGEARFIPVEYAGRYRDALGVPLPHRPSRIAAAAGSRTPACDLARRYSRTHGPFTTEEFATRYGLGRATAEVLLKELAIGGRLLEGEFRPGGTRPRMVRRRGPAVGPAPVAGEAAQGGRACRPADPRASGDDVAGSDPPAHRARRAARYDREPAGRAAARFDLRERDPGGSHRGLQPDRSRCAHCRWRDRLVRRRSRSANATAGSLSI